MDHILWNLRAVAVNINYQDSYQVLDHNLVFDNRKDDGGNQNDSRINPFNQDFLKME